MNATKTLKRKPVVANVFAQAVDDNIQDLAARSTKLFGYNLLEKRISSRGNSVDLLNAMNELGIQPFTQRSVDKYKTKMVSKELSPPAWVELILAQAGIALLISVAIAFGAWLFGHAIAAQLAGWFALGFFVVSAVIALVSGVALTPTDTRAEWKITRFSGDYIRQIPEYALQTAVDLKEKCPSADFYIDELEVTILQRREYDYDPFLVVRDTEGNEYYLEVWNEPGFKSV